ncbi:hypothetical protein BKA61DRAFT_603605 [Leptodontidium sp. MPI-SDFR-AT-0119]|nr:hypothetical protein BKA61DRAFT_603605 [Leptodontidium sp. MPI-SDFR-AT-0119]
MLVLNWVGFSFGCHILYCCCAGAYAKLGISGHDKKILIIIDDGNKSYSYTVKCGRYSLSLSSGPGTGIGILGLCI